MRSPSPHSRVSVTSLDAAQCGVRRHPPGHRHRHRHRDAICGPTPHLRNEAVGVIQSAHCGYRHIHREAAARSLCTWSTTPLTDATQPWQVVSALVAAEDTAESYPESIPRASSPGWASRHGPMPSPSRRGTMGLQLLVRQPAVAHPHWHARVRLASGRDVYEGRAGMDPAPLPLKRMKEVAAFTSARAARPGHLAAPARLSANSGNTSDSGSVSGRM